MKTLYRDMLLCHYHIIVYVQFVYWSQMISCYTCSYSWSATEASGFADLILFTNACLRSNSISGSFKQVHFAYWQVTRKWKPLYMHLWGYKVQLLVCQFNRYSLFTLSSQLGHCSYPHCQLWFNHIFWYSCPACSLKVIHNLTISWKTK